MVRNRVIILRIDIESSTTRMRNPVVTEKAVVSSVLKFPSLADLVNSSVLPSLPASKTLP
jgi:hypothetical protein